MRKFLAEHVPAFKPRSGYADLALDLGDDATFDRVSLAPDALEALVRRALIRTLFREMFGASIPSDALAAYVEYGPLGGTCVLGAKFHTATAGTFLRQLEPVRLRIKAAIRATPVGERIVAAAGLDADAVLLQLADGSAFAGMLGTLHLATHALARLRSAPALYVPLYQKDPIAFLHEEARVDPPVTSVTAVLPAERTLELSPRPVNVTFPRGNPYQLSLSTANTDPLVFGGNYHSRSRADAFDPTREHSDESVSWNGRLRDVEAGDLIRAPRGCPGYKLSMELARALVSKFAPTKDAVPVPLAPCTPGAGARLAAQGPLARGADCESTRLLEQRAEPISYFDRVGWGIWLIFTVGAVGYMMGTGAAYAGAVSTLYVEYLGAQALVATGALVSSFVISHIAMVAAATTYFRILARVLHNSEDAAEEKTARAWRERRQRVYELLSIAVGAALAAVILWTHTMFSGGETMITPAIFAYYGASAAAATCVVWHHLMHEASDANPLFSFFGVPLTPGRLGVIGGSFGVLDIALVPLGGAFGHIACHTADSLLYVTPILAALPSMNKMYARTASAWPSDSTIVISAVRIRRAAAFGCITAAIAIAAILVTIGGGRICAWETQTLSPADAVRCSNNPLSSVGLYGRVIHYLVRASPYPPGPSPDEDSRSVSLPQFDRRLPLVEPFPGSAPIDIPTDDEDEDVPGFSDDLQRAVKSSLLALLRSPEIFPFTDSPRTWTTIEEARSTLALAAGHDLPAPVSDWTGVDVTADETISRMTFAGFAGWRLRLLTADEQRYAEKDGATYAVSFAELKAFPVRAGFERFGATAFFNSSRHVVCINVAARDLDVRPVDAAPHDWAHAKWVWRSSAIVGATANEHLMMNHLVFSNIAMRAAREKLPRDHPLRRFLKPFNHRTPTVNMNAMEFLTLENSLLHRTLAFTYDGLVGALQAGLHTARMRGSPLAHLDDVSAELGAAFPFAEDGNALYKVVKNFTAAYVSEYYTSDAALLADSALKDMWDGVRVFGDSSGLPEWKYLTRPIFTEFLASFVWHVTGGHHLFGNVAEFLKDPTFVTGRLRAGSEVADVEASHLALCVAILTGMRAPRLLSDFKHVLLDDAHILNTSAYFDDFQADLLQLDDAIAERNVQRPWRFDGFSPHRLLSSVAI